MSLNSEGWMGIFNDIKEMDPSLPRCVATAELKKGGLSLMDNQFTAYKMERRRWNNMNS